MSNSTKNWKWLFLICVLIVLSHRLGFNRRVTFPKSYKIKEFPTLKQPDMVTCGPTSVVMVADYYGVKVGVDEISDMCKTYLMKKDDGVVIGGTTPEYISVSLDKLGIENRLIRNSNLNFLKSYVSKGFPTIVLVRSGKLTWHYVVVVGYDKYSIIVADPGDGEISYISTKIFDEAWGFTSDLSGRDTSQQCPVCNGTGRVLNGWGPFGVCDVCSGVGKQPNWMKVLVNLGEAKERTMVVAKGRNERKIK